MLALQHLGQNGVNAATGTATTITCPVTVTCPPDQLVVVRVASGAISGSNGPSDDHHLTDSAGTVYTKVAEVTRIDDTGGFRTGVTVSLWTARPATGIPLSSVLTCTFDASVNARAICLDTYSTVKPVNTVILAGVNTAHGSSDGSSDPAVIETPATVNDFCWIGAGAFDAQPNLAVPTPSNWLADRIEVTNGGNNGTGMTLFGMHRVVEAESQNWTITTASGRHWGLILAAFALVGPAVPVKPGARELQADFDTATDGGSGITLSRRPDAIALDRLTAYSYGPATLNDPAGGVLARSWRARATASKVYLTQGNAGNDDWGVEFELFSYSGNPIDELSLCFAVDGRPVLVAERDTGGSGTPEVWLYWYNAGIAAFEFVTLDAGRTPRCVLDQFPHTSSHCAPSPDVQIVYLKPGSGLVRREQRSSYATLFASPLPYVDHIWIEDFFPTIGRRLVVVYSRRDVLHGTYELRRLESLVYEDSLLHRPVFFPNEVNDIVWSQGSQFLGAATTAVYQMRVGVLDDVDAIEVAAADVDFTIATGWQVQVQEATGGFVAGASHQFPFTIVGGGGGMVPRAFRARTRKVVGAATCYSPWLYWFAGRSAGNLSAVRNSTDDTAHTANYTVSSTDGNLWLQYILPGGTAVNRTNIASPFTFDLQQVDDPSIGGGWVDPLRFAARNQEVMRFTEQDGDYAFMLLSRAAISGASASPWVPLGPLDQNQTPGPFPPNPDPT